MPIPVSYHSLQRPIGSVLREWLEGESLADLLPVYGHKDDLVEPPWLCLCEYLASPSLLGVHDLSKDSDHQALVSLRQRLWGSTAGVAESLINDLFPQGEWLATVAPESAQRALAVAEWARQCFAYPTDRKLPLGNPIEAEMHPLEQALLERFWLRSANALGVPDVQISVLLVQPEAAKDDRGRLCCLRLWKVDISAQPEWASWHGAVVRAPAASLLNLKSRHPKTGVLDDSFEHALRKIECLLQACLAPPKPSGEGAYAMAWSFQPVAMAHELAGGQKKTEVPIELRLPTGHSHAALDC